MSRAARWFVEVSRVGKSDKAAERICVEAAQWQPALQRAREMRGDTGSFANFSVELLDDGYRAIDPGTRLRYVVRRAPEDAELTDPDTVTSEDEAPASRPSRRGKPSALAKHRKKRKSLPPGANGAGKSASASESPTPSAPPSVPPPEVAFELVFKREEEPSDAVPMAYREYAYAVDEDATVEQAEQVIRSCFSQVRRSLVGVSANRYVNLAVFDHAFDDKPLRRPLVALTWKDWRGKEPEIQYPAKDAAAALEKAAKEKAAADAAAKKAAAEKAAEEKAAAEKKAAEAKAAAEKAAAEKAAAEKAAAEKAAAEKAAAEKKAAEEKAAAEKAAEEKAAAEKAAAEKAEAEKAAAERKAAEEKAAAEKAAAAKAAEEEAAAQKAERASEPPVSQRPTMPSEALDALSSGPSSKSGKKKKRRKKNPEISSTRPQTPAAKRKESDRPPPSASKTLVDATPASAVGEAKVGKTLMDATPSSARTSSAPPSSMASERPARTSSMPPGSMRYSGDDLIVELFEACGELGLLPHALDGAEFVLQLVQEKLPSELVLVSFFDINKREFVVVAHDGGSDETLLSRQKEQTKLVDLTMRKGRSVVVPGDDPRIEKRRFEQFGVEPASLLLAPVELGGRYLGIIELANALDGQDYSAGDGHALTYIGQQFGEFLGNRDIIIDPDQVREHRRFRGR